MRTYNNFDEINRDLKYLKLKTKIDLEEIKLSIKSTQDVVSETFSPRNLMANAVAGLAKKSFYGRIVERLVPTKPLQNLVKRLF